MLRIASRGRKIGWILITNLLLLALGLAALEAFFHIFHVLRIQWIEGDPNIGFNIPANYAADFADPEYPECHFIYKSNNRGFREDKNTEITSNDSIRIVVFGDSHTDGACWNRESYPHRLEYYLNLSHPGYSAEVINAGTGKYSPFQYLRAYQYRVKPLHPDIVILGFYVGNDFFDMFRRDDRPSLEIKADGRIAELPPEFFFYTKPGFTSSPLAKSYVYYILFGSRFWKEISYTISRSVIFYRNARKMNNVSTSDLLKYFRDLYRLVRIHRHAATQSLSQFVFFHYFPDKLGESMRLVEYTLARFRDEQAWQQPFRLILAPIPSRFQVEGHRLTALRRELEKRFSYIISTQPQMMENAMYDSLIRMAARLKIELLDLRPVLSENAKEKKLYFDGDFHIDPTAHDIIGRKISAYLDSTGLGNGTGIKTP